MEMICSLIAENVPESIVGYTGMLSDQNRHGFDLAYDLSTLTYIERGDEDRFYGREVIFIFASRKTYPRIINYYPGEDKIRPMLTKNSEESFTLSWGNSKKRPHDVDITTTRVCDCLTTIKSPEYPLYLPPDLTIDRTYKLQTSSGELIGHPVFLPDQKPHLTVGFYRRFPNIPGDYNNVLVCGEFPCLYLSG
jgi:hypothetical protein